MIQLIENQNFVKILNANQSILDLISEFLSYIYKGPHPQTGLPCKIKLTLLKNSEFPSGALPAVIKKLSALNIPFTTNSITLPKLDTFIYSDEFPIYEDMKWIVEKGCNIRKGIIKVATGGGKTRLGVYIAYNIFKSLNKKTIWVSTFTDALVDAEDEYNLIRDSLNESEDFITFITRASAAKITDKLNSDYELMIVDEVQDVCMGQWSTILSDAPLRTIGMSGSLIRQDGQELVIMGYVGLPFCDITKDYLLTKGRVTKTHVVFHNFNYEKYHKSKLDKALKKYPSFEVMLEYPEIIRLKTSLKLNNELMEMCVWDCNERHDFIINLAKAIIDKGGFPLIIHDRIDHGKKLIERFSKLFPDIKTRLIISEVKKKDRKEIYEDCRAGNIHCLVSTVAYRSINIHRMTDLILVGAPKSPQKFLQSAGRLFRIFSSKETSFLHIINDSCHKILSSKTQKLMTVALDYGFYSITSNQYYKEILKWKEAPLS